MSQMRSSASTAKLSRSVRRAAVNDVLQMPSLGTERIRRGFARGHVAVTRRTMPPISLFQSYLWP